MAIKFKDRPLDEVVSQFADNEILYIGSASSYFFIGTKKEFDKLIDKISDATIKNAKKNLLHTKKVTDSMISKIGSIEPSSTASYYKEIRRICAAICSDSGATISGLLFIEGFTPLRTRRVHTVERMSETSGFRIIVVGKELGRYWFKNEFDKEWGEIGDSHDFHLDWKNDAPLSDLASYSRKWMDSGVIE